MSPQAMCRMKKIFKIIQARINIALFFIPVIMIQLKRTDSSDPHFSSLAAQLDKFLTILNGEKDDFFAQFNKSSLIKHVIVAYNDGKLCGCGAIKEFDPETIEIKRMFVMKDQRGLGIATKILNSLEQWALEMEYKKCILETSKELKEAISLYNKNGYTKIPNFGQYQNVENSICFEKYLQ